MNRLGLVISAERMVEKRADCQQPVGKRGPRTLLGRRLGGGRRQPFFESWHGTGAMCRGLLPGTARGLCRARSGQSDCNSVVGCLGSGTEDGGRGPSPNTSLFKFFVGSVLAEVVGRLR